MFSILRLILVKAVDVEVAPTEDTIMQAVQEPVASPVQNDLQLNKMVTTSILSMHVNPTKTKEVEGIPQWVKQFAGEQAGSATGDNSKQYNMFTSDALQKSPGWTNDPDNQVLHHTVICEMQQTGKCPEGYMKVALDNFRERSIDELKSLLKKNHGKPLGNKTAEPGSKVEPTEKEAESEVAPAEATA